MKIKPDFDPYREIARSGYLNGLHGLTPTDKRFPPNCSNEYLNQVWLDNWHEGVEEHHRRRMRWVRRRA